MQNKDINIQNKTKHEIDDYFIIENEIPNSGNIKLRIIHKTGGKHFAEHSKVQVLNSNLESIGTESINKNNINLIIDTIRSKGITEGLFVIKDKDGNYEKKISILNKKISPNILSLIHI